MDQEPEAKLDGVRSDLPAQVAVMCAEIGRQLKQIDARLYVVQRALGALQQDLDVVRAWLERRDNAPLRNRKAGESPGC